MATLRSAGSEHRADPGYLSDRSASEQDVKQSTDSPDRPREEHHGGGSLPDEELARPQDDDADHNKATAPTTNPR
jgi:hypothetical protein